jgi:hypothetical protein
MRRIPTEATFFSSRLGQLCHTMDAAHGTSSNLERLERSVRAYRFRSDLP